VNQKALLLADVHFGKIGHFRKEGIPLPAHAATADLHTLEAIFRHFDIREVYFLGDLFHSSYNPEFELLHDFINQFKDIQFHLIVGNHDRSVANTKLMAMNLHIHPDELIAPPFVFRHEPEPHPSGYVLSGHIHPAFRLKGKARQSVTLPCFWFSEKVGVLPAFGHFTGKALIQPKKGDLLFLIAGDMVVGTKQSS
jgi:DNA ligase-associated metallophosphoesterase